MMNGILVVDKPQGFTSFDVVAKLRGICATKKIGHGGTLDPMATGVLPVFVGAAAKAVDLAPNQDKAYRAALRFGIRTDTGDVTGTVLETRGVTVTAAQLAAVLPRFVGKQMQTPPMVSAVKVDGKPLYKYAREGVQVQRKARQIEIFSISSPEAVTDAASTTNLFSVEVACGKGTYIRTLAEDIGAALGVPATLAGLVRTQSGRFTLAQAHTLAEIQAAKDAGVLENLLLPVEVLFEELPRLDLDEKAAVRLLNGAPVYGMRGEAGVCRLFAPSGFIGLGGLAASGQLRAEKLFVERT